MRKPLPGNTTSGIEHLRQRGWVSLNQFAKLIGVSYPTALKMREKGQVVAIHVGSTWRIYTSEVRRFMTEGNADEPTDLTQLAKELGREMPRMSVEGEGNPALSPFSNPHIEPTPEEEA